jgi:pimeloyl-ACP methyl ester carboxylesterase
MVQALDPGIEIIRVDVPGVGGSPVRVWPFGFPELAGLLAVLLDQLGYQQVDVLGFSWGGALARQFAVQYRGRCRRLVLICTSTWLLSIPGRPHVVGKMLNPKRFRGAGPRRGPAVRGTSAVTVTTFGGCSGTARSGFLVRVTCINSPRLPAGPACRSWD